MTLTRRWIACLLLFTGAGGLLVGRENDALSSNPAVTDIVLEMSAFTGKARTSDAAFAQILDRAATLLRQAKERHEPASVLINLERNATYRIARPIQFNRLGSLQIAGRGAKIVNTSTFHATFAIRSCEHLTFSDLSIDYDPVPFTQGVITAIDASARRITIKIDSGYPDSVELLARLNDGIFRVIDRVTKALKPGARTFISVDHARSLNQGVVQVDLVWSANDLGPGQTAVRVGDVAVVSGSYGAAITLDDSAFVSFDGFDLYAAPGIGIVANAGAGGIILRHVVIIPGPRPPGATADRLVSTNSDGTHFAAAERGPSIEDCTYADTGDDAINVHGFYLFVVKKLGPRQFMLSPKQDVGLEAGDNIEAYGGTNLDSRGRTRVVHLTKRRAPEMMAEIAPLWKNRSPTSLPATVYEVEFQRDLPLKFGDVVASLSRTCTGTTVRNCVFHACGRVMIKSSDSVIENNRFSFSRGVAVFVGSDFGFWVESNFVRNLAIRNNRFTHCNIGANNCFGNSDADGPGTIYLGISPPSDHMGYLKDFENRNVVIAGNEIEDSYLYAIFATNAAGLKIDGNVVGKTFIRGSAFSAGRLYGLAPNSAIFLAMSKGAEVKGNTVSRGAIAKVPVSIDRSCVPGTIVSANNTLK